MALWLRGALLALIAFVCSAGCERNSESNYPARFPFAYVQRECGPTDGDALNFYFTLNQRQLGKYQEPFLVISVNENVPSSAPQDYSIKLGKYALLASRCLSPGKCDAAISGYLHLTTFSRGGGATGKYELHFQEGRVERDSFAATWHVVERLTCG
jgi:hypothetical protein